MQPQEEEKQPEDKNDERDDFKPDLEDNGNEPPAYQETDLPWSVRIKEVFHTFWPLGFVAFGGKNELYGLFRLFFHLSREYSRVGYNK